MKKLILLIVMMLQLAGLSIGQNLYVKSKSSGKADGSSWENASDNLQQMIANANYGAEIWATEGVYKFKEDLDCILQEAIDKRIYIYGGFSGDETERDQRDVKRNKTYILNEMKFSKSNFGIEVGPLSDAEGKANAGIIDGFIFGDSDSNEFSNRSMGGSLTTLFAQNNNFAGNMFNVTAHGGDAIVIQKFDVNISGVLGTISVYYRPGTYVGFESSAAGWTLLGSQQVIPAGINLPTEVNIGGLVIPAGETYGLYVTVSDYPAVTMFYTNGNNVYSNADITIETGIGKGNPDFAGTNFLTRTWNGTIYYTVGLPACEFTSSPDNVNCNTGSSSCNSSEGIYTVSSEGCFSASGTSDSQAFAQNSLCGDGTIEAKIVSITGNGFAGLQFRESNAAGSKFVALKTQLSNFVFRGLRSVTNGNKSTQSILRPNHSWLRLVRKGNSFQGFSSPDGVNWQLVFTTNVAMNSCIQFGLIAESPNNSQTTVATFSNVSSDSGSPAFVSNTGTNQSSYQFSSNEFSIYPNPGFNQFFVDVPANAKSAEMVVYNSLGKKVFFTELQGGSIQEINLEGNPGLYLFSILQDGEEPRNVRVVKQ